MQYQYVKKKHFGLKEEGKLRGGQVDISGHVGWWLGPGRGFEG
jgi:hypothetical protein